MGFIFCGIAVACFTAFYLLVTFSQKRGTDPMGLNLATFATGLLFGTAAAMPVSPGQFPMNLILIGGLIGATAGLGLLGITLAVRSGVPVSLVNLMVSLSPAVPILLSLAFFDETPSLRQWAGVGFAGLAIFLIQEGAG